MDIDTSWLKIEGVEKSEEEFYSWLKNQVENHPVVKTQHPKWIELMEWEEGNQFSEYSDTARAVVPVELTRARRVVINFMKPLVETIDGKINFAHQMVGMPNSGERKDIDGATVSTKLLTFNDDVSFAPKVMDDMKWDMLRTGNGCIRWFWNPAKKAKAGKLNKDGVVVGTKDIEGDVDCYSPNIFNLRPDPFAKSPEDMRQHVEIKEITRDQVLTAYPDFPEEWLAAGETTGAMKYKGLNVEQNEVDKEVKTFMLYEFLEMSSSDYKDGRMVVYVGSHCVHADKNPNPDTELGYYYYYYRKSKKSFWGRGPLYYVQDTQRNLNRMVSMEAEHVESWRPKLAVPIGSLARANSLTVGPFEVVELSYDRGDPRPINMPELSAHVGQLRDFYMASKDMISNVHEVSYARLPQYASRAPNSLYESMLEQESLKLDPMIKRTNQTLINSARFRLKLMAAHYDQKRMVKILGPNKIASIRFFDKVDLNSNYDVQVEIGVSMNQSTSMQNRLVLDLWEKKVFEGPQDRVKILKILNLGTAEAELRSDLADSDRAQRENQAFQDGTWEPTATQRGVYVFIHDDHVLHLESHTSLMKSAEAEAWDDETTTGMINHIQEHYGFWVQLQQQAASPTQQAPAKAGSAGLGQPPPPQAPTSPQSQSGPPPGQSPGQGAPMSA